MYLEARGIRNVSADLPGVCDSFSPEFAKIEWENGKPSLVTKTGRSSDILVCPSCHNELFRDTEENILNTAVFFGRKDSGKTSLILALAGECITKQFSPDEKYRYFFNEKLYDPNRVTSLADRVKEGAKPDDLREPVAIYRVTGGSDSRVVCDVLHDVSASDTLDEMSINITMPFASDAAHFVYCIAADKLAEALVTDNTLGNMTARLDMFRMISAFRYAQTAPTLDITITKIDLAQKLGGAAADILNVREDERALKNYITTAFPCIAELEQCFGGIRVHTVSANAPASGDDDIIGKYYCSIFG
jgi:uncharacterized protein YbaR (Trm112 family)